MRWLQILTVAPLALLIAAMPARGQDAQSGQTDSAASSNSGSQAPASDASPSQTLTQAQLEQLVAPIALYPDPLLAQVLMASTYPLEVVQAARWLDTHASLQGDALTQAADSQDWDDSVKSLTATPSVLQMMNKDLDWTQKLGDAVIAQQADVMSAVQALRAKAQSAGKLESNQQQKVTVQDQGTSAPTIVIEPVKTDTIYVPYYDPAVVYGPWPYPAYPAYYFPPEPRWVIDGAIANGIAWGAGVAFGAAMWDGFDWHGGNIHVNINNINIHNNFTRNDVKFQNWQHNASRARAVGADGDGGRFNDLNKWMGEHQDQDKGRFSAPGASGSDGDSGDGKGDKGGDRQAGPDGQGDKRDGPDADDHRGDADRPDADRRDADDADRGDRDGDFDRGDHDGDGDRGDHHDHGDHDGGDHGDHRGGGGDHRGGGGGHRR